AWQLVAHLDRPGAVLELLLGPMMGDLVVDRSLGHRQPLSVERWRAVPVLPVDGLALRRWRSR
ncbi:MAG: hypothetical protein ACYCXN_15280, partial [Acidimicrobiales bacterium]